MSILTNYNFENQFGDFTNFCLSPLVTAIGDKVTFKGSVESYNGLKVDERTFEQHKTSHIALRIIAAVGALVLLPMTLVGLAVRHLSSSNAKYDRVADELMALEQRKFENTVKMNELQGLSSNTFQEKITKILQVGDVVGTNAELGINKNEQGDLVEELKELLSEVVVKVTQDPKNPWASPTYDLNEGFKQDVTYKECLDLKRMLSRLRTLESKYAFQSGKKVRFNEFHQKVRDFYYDKFTADHMVKQLSSKGHVKGMQVKLNNISPASLEEIKTAYSAPITPCQVTWLHGTDSAALVDLALENSLKPKKGDALIGYDMIQQAYALREAQLISNISDTCKADPDDMLQSYKAHFEAVLKDLRAGRWTTDKLDRYQKDAQRSMVQKQLKILAQARPEAYAKDIIPTLKELEGALMQHACYYQVRNLVHEAQKVELSPSSTYAEEDTKLALASYPLIFGATEMDLVNTVKQRAPGSKKQADTGYEEPGYHYKGSLQLKTDLQYLFVPQAQIEGTRQYLQSKKIEGVRVTNFETLQIATSFQEYKRKKMNNFRYT